MVVLSDLIQRSVDEKQDKVEMNGNDRPAVRDWFCRVKGQFSAHPVQMFPKLRILILHGATLIEYWGFENNWPNSQISEYIMTKN